MPTPTMTPDAPARTAPLPPGRLRPSGAGRGRHDWRSSSARSPSRRPGPPPPPRCRPAGSATSSRSGARPTPGSGRSSTRPTGCRGDTYPPGLVSVARAGLSGGGSIRRIALADLRALVHASRRPPGRGWRSSRPTAATRPRSGPSPTGSRVWQGLGTALVERPAGPLRAPAWPTLDFKRSRGARPGATRTGPAPERAAGWPATPGATASS